MDLAFSLLRLDMAAGDWQARFCSLHKAKRLCPVLHVCEYEVSVVGPPAAGPASAAEDAGSSLPCRP